MTPEQRASFINAQIAIFNSRVAGMVAENQQRAVLGQSMAYQEDSFSVLEKEFEPILGQNAIIEFFNK